MSLDKKNQVFEWMKSYAYRFSEKPFRLASGKESQHYFNCKEITLHPERLHLLCEVLIEEVIPKFPGTFGAIGGLTLGADPLTYGLALAYQARGIQKYPLIIRKEAKDHGTGQQVEGFHKEVKQCLVLDDVITTGGSTIKAVRALREVGIEVTKGVCILDRQEGGREALEKEGIHMEALFRKEDFR
ncbi:orotate phosphoribosyltransferase [Leptospira ryugenii]|nr:orotate phosphoribosyltransferase [Leptospira ryugenii]